MRLFTLFISRGTVSYYYCGVYPTLKHLYDVIHEMAESEGINKDEIPKLEKIRHEVIDGDTKDYWHEFSDGTWIHIQETSEQLVQAIKDTYDTLDGSLVKWAVRNARPHRPGKWPRWGAVKECFAVGSTTAIALCHRFELDPNEQLDGPECEHCALDQTTK